MADKVTNVITNFKMDGQVEYASTAKEINTVMNTAAKEYKAQVAAMGQDATQTEKLGALKQKLQIQLEGAQKRTALLREEYERMAKDTNTSTEALNKQYGKVKDSETAEARLKTQLDNTNKGLKEQGNVSVSAAEKLEKISNAGEKVGKVGKVMSVGVTAPILAVGAASTKAFDEVDGAMDTVIAKSGATGKEADALQQNFNHVAGTGPFELQSVGDAMGALRGQMGLTGKSLESSTTQVLRFAEVNKTDVSSAIHSAQQAMGAYNLSNKDFNMVLDVTTNVAQKAGLDVGTLTDTVVKAAPQMKQLGLGFGESAQLLGQFSKSGVDGTKAVSLLSKASVTYAKDGKTLTQGLAETESKIKNAKTSTEALTAASEIFGTKGASVMVDAIKKGTLNLSDLSKQAKDAGGSVKNTFEATEDPIDKMKTASNNAKIALADISSTIQGMLAPMLESVVSKLRGVVEWFQQLSPQQKEMAVKIAAIAAAIGPVLMIVDRAITSVKTIIPVIKSVGTAFQALNAVMAANPIGAIVVAVSALAAGLIWFFTQTTVGRQMWSSFVQWLQGLWQGVQSFFTGIWNGITSVFSTAVNGISSWWNQTWTGIVNFIKPLWQGMQSFFQTVWNAIKLVFTVAVTAIALIIGTSIKIWQTVITTVMNAIKAVITTIWNAIKGFIMPVVDAIKAGITAGWNAIKSVTTTVFNAIKSVVTAVWNAIKTAITIVINAIKSVVTDVWNGLKSVTTSVFNAIKSVVTSVWNGIKSTVTNVVNGVKSAVEGAWNAISSTTSRVWNAIKSAISTPINAAKDLVSRAIDAIKGFFNFHITWPHIPMPHFSIEPSGWQIGDLLKGKIPHLGLTWNAQGALFNKPTVAGVADGRFQGFGEAGPEAAIPMNDETLRKIGKGIAANMPASGPVYLQVDGKTFARLFGPYINEGLGRLSGDQNLALGRS